MNTNTMELSLNEMEMAVGGDFLDRLKGALIGAGICCATSAVGGFVAAGPFGAVAGAISGAAAGAIGGAMSGYEKMVVEAAYITGSIVD